MKTLLEIYRSPEAGAGAEPTNTPPTPGTTEGGTPPAATATTTGEAGKTAEQIAAEAAAGGEKKTESEAGKTAEAKKTEGEAAPLTVESLKMPEGFEVAPEAAKGFLEIFNNKELAPADRANKLVEWYAGEQTRQAQAWVDRQKADGEKITADPEIGGANFPASQTAFANVLKEFGSPELIADLNASGLGNKLSFARFLVGINKVTSEGKPIVGAPTSGGAKTAAETLYPTQGKV